MCLNFPSLDYCTGQGAYAYQTQLYRWFNIRILPIIDHINKAYAFSGRPLDGIDWLNITDDAPDTEKVCEANVPPAFYWDRELSLQYQGQVEYTGFFRLPGEKNKGTTWVKNSELNASSEQFSSVMKEFSIEYVLLNVARLCRVPDMLVLDKVSKTVKFGPKVKNKDWLLEALNESFAKDPAAGTALKKEILSIHECLLSAVHTAQTLKSEIITHLIADFWSNLDLIPVVRRYRQKCIPAVTYESEESCVTKKCTLDLSGFSFPEGKGLLALKLSLIGANFFAQVELQEIKIRGLGGKAKTYNCLWHSRALLKDLVELMAGILSYISSVPSIESLLVGPGTWFSCQGSEKITAQLITIAEVSEESAEAVLKDIFKDVTPPPGRSYLKEFMKIVEIREKD